MSASQDKVQGILQTLLEESLPLVQKGIFTRQQLQLAMCQREKHENNMLKSTFKLSDYLKAIQFQYNLQRTRRSRLQSLAPTNPLFKKQTKTDFVIVKRIIRLWDRTMHKFKYNVQLWKQYLDFCIKAHCKNQFYKALSNGLRFLPFCQDLWLIGVQYQVEVGLNLWKGRKIFIKALRMNQKKVSLWLNMFKFQINFLKSIHEREKAIQGNDTMQFITNQQQQNKQANQQQQEQQNEQDIQKMNNLNLKQHDDILFIVFEQCYNKVEQKDKLDAKAKMIATLKQYIKKQRDQFVSGVLKSAQKKIESHVDAHVDAHVADEEMKQKKEYRVLVSQNNISKSSIQEKLQYYQSYITQNSNLTSTELDKIICQFITKPAYLVPLLSHYLQYLPKNAVDYLLTSNKFKAYCLPAQTIQKLIEKTNLVMQNLQSMEGKQNQIGNYNKKITTIIRNISTSKYVECLGLLEEVIKTNKKFKNYKLNQDIYRSVSVQCKKKPEILERCMHWIHEQEAQ